MTTSFEASTRAGDAVQPSLSTLQTNRLRMALLVGREERTAEFRYHADTLGRLTADSSGDTTGRERAMAALQMYVAREAIEEIQDSLLRMRRGGYGTCQSCGQPISLAHLEVFPRARCCAACSTASTLAGRAEKAQGKRVTMNPERGHMGASRRALEVLARGPSALEPSPLDPIPDPTAA